MRSAIIRTEFAILIVTVCLAIATSTLGADPRLPLQMLTLIGLLCAGGLALRLVFKRRLGLTVGLLQLLAVLGWVGRALSPVVTEGEWSTYLAGSIKTLRDSAIPVPNLFGVDLLFVLIPTLVYLALEAIMFVARDAGWAILPLGGWFIGFALLPQLPQATLFLIAAGGFALLLAIETVNRGRSWRRNLRSETGTGNDTDGTIARLGLLLAVPALLAGVVIGSTMPLLPRFDAGFGGPATISVTDPTLDMRRNLHQLSTVEVLRYASDHPGGIRLRLAALTQLDSQQGWRLTGFRTQRIDRGTGDIGPVPGVNGYSPTQSTTNVVVDSLESQYLPVPFAARTLRAAKQWGFDPSSLSVFTLSSRTDQVKRLAYSVVSDNIEPTQAELSAAGTASPGAEALQLPTMPSSVVQLTQAITSKARSPLERASAIQNYLRGPDFTYDLNKGPSSSGVAALTTFVTRDRVGYCEQFAGAMAAMARIVGIPSRVVIGFLPGHEEGDHWVVSNKDYHAWVELYFGGYGWVQFEPTPGSVSGPAPAWTAQVEIGTPPPAPSSPPSGQFPTAQPQFPTQEPSGAPLPSNDGTGPAVPWQGLLFLVVLLGVLALGMVPRLIRELQRRRRLGLAGTPAARALAAWQEVRDTVLDTGRPWPTDSPRAIAAGLGQWLGKPARDRLEVLAIAVERVRFSRGLDAGPADLGGIVGSIRADLYLALPPERRLTSAWLPASLWAALVAWAGRTRPAGVLARTRRPARPTDEAD